MEKYAYIDKGGIMHIVESQKTAEEYKGKGFVIAVDIEAEYGYPIVDRKQVIVYSPKQMKHSAKGGDIPVIKELAKLYERCLGIK